MALLAMAGPVQSVLAAEPWAGTGLGTGITILAGAPTIASTPLNNPAYERYCFKIAGAQTFRFGGTGGTSGADYWFQLWFQISAFPTTTTTALFQKNQDSILGYGVCVDSSGRLQLFYGTQASPTLVGSLSSALALNTPYCLDFRQNITTLGSGTAEFWLNGVQIASDSSMTVANSSPSANFDVGSAAANGFNWSFSSLRCCDTSGTANNGRFRPGYVSACFPVSDSARTGFTGGAAGTTNLWDALNNDPPVGVIVGSATDTSQIKDATSNTTDNYQPNVGAYTDSLANGGAGMKGGIVHAVRGFARGGNSSVTSRTMGVTVMSNPAGNESVGGTGTTAAGTDPTGWKSIWTAFVEDPAVTLGTQPTLRFRKGTASTDNMMADQMGLQVAFEPRSFVFADRARRNSLLRS